MLLYFDVATAKSHTLPTSHAQIHRRMITFFTGFGSPSRTLFAILPRLSRSLVNRAASRPIPQTQGIDLLRPDVAHRLTPSLPGTETISTPHEFLRAIGRSSETKLTIEKWEDFWKTSGQDLKKLGLAVRDRRHVHGI